MTSKLKLLATSAVATVAILGSTPAFAADLGTDAGTSITNSVSITYTVGGSTQTPPPVATDTFVVDRRVNLLVEASDALNTTVGPGETQAAVTFDVTNLTNDTIDVLLTNEQPTSDDFDAITPTYYLDDGNGIFDGGDVVVTSIDDLDEDETVTIHVVSNVPGGVATGDLADLILIGQAADSTTGIAFADDSGDADDPTLVQNVFADAAGDGTGDGAGDGFHSATDTYEVAAADISVFKSSRVVSDPINGTTNPKAIPGAVIEYCISVANAGPATASGVTITDTLPADVGGNGITFVPSSILLDGTAVITGAGPTLAQTCSGGSAGGSFADPTVSGTLSDVTSGNNRALIFQVTVD